MFDDYKQVKVLRKVKETIDITKFENPYIVLDTGDKLLVDVTLKIAVMIVLCAIIDNARF